MTNVADEKDFLHAINGSLGVLLNNIEALEMMVGSKKKASAAAAQLPWTEEHRERLRIILEAALKLKDLAGARRDLVRNL